jgi:hypothetical protein
MSVYFFVTEGEGPHLIEGTGLSATFGKDEVMKIHHENVHKLRSMSQLEIAEEQRKLLEILGMLTNNIYIMKRKFKELWSTNSPISTKQTITSRSSINTKKTTTYDNGNLSPCLGQAQTCGKVKLVKGIPTLSS